MKKNLKTILAGLSALTILSTAPALNAYTISQPKLLVQSEERDMHIDVDKDGRFVYTRLNFRGSPPPSEIRVNEDGLDKIISQGYSDTFPAFSPDGEKVAFFRNYMAGFGLIHVIDVDGKNLEEIALAKIGNVSWSPDGKELVFTCDYLEEKRHILTEEDIEALKKQYDTDKIAYKPGDEVKYQQLYNAINIVDVETKEIKYLTTNEGNCQDPEFTGDGRIVYIFNKNLSSTVGKEIWIMDKDGKNKQPLVQPENYRKTVQNDDGTSTVYERESSASQISIDGNLMVYLLETSDRVLRKIPKGGEDYDVKELKKDYHSGIYLKNLETGETKLVTDEGNLWFPEIKDNKVYFSRYDNFETEHDIYCIDLEK